MFQLDPEESLSRSEIRLLPQATPDVGKPRSSSSAKPRPSDSPVLSKPHRTKDLAPDSSFTPRRQRSSSKPSFEVFELKVRVVCLLV